MKIHLLLLILISNAVEFLLYAPTRPVVDFSVLFLWAMAVGTIVTASLWQEFGTSEHTNERYNELSPKVYHFLFSIRYYEVYSFILYTDVRLIERNLLTCYKEYLHVM